MAYYKLNRFHWHLTEDQGWRIDVPGYIVPEIELPGHVYAALAAYPQYACRPENLAERTPRLVWGIEKDVLCVGNDEAIRLMENVVDWVCKVFPGDVVHIGVNCAPLE